MLLLEKMLKDAGLTYLQVQEKGKELGLKISQVTLSNIIKGKTSPKVSTIEDIATILGCHITDFFPAKPKAEKTIDSSFEVVIKELQEIKASFSPGSHE